MSDLMLPPCGANAAFRLLVSPVLGGGEEEKIYTAIFVWILAAKSPQSIDKLHAFTLTLTPYHTVHNNKLSTEVSNPRPVGLVSIPESDLTDNVVEVKKKKIGGLAGAKISLLKWAVNLTDFKFLPPIIVGDVAI
ncbi:hypothetical protein C8R44DRAFT_731138 [Mycena epipterygia]|nr:hypothetical protein C8R44DRAFT_731138 [Mycena epipterygia]